MSVMEYLKTKQQVLSDLEWQLVNQTMSKFEVSQTLQKNIPALMSQIKRPPMPIFFSNLKPSSNKISTNNNFNEGYIPDENINKMEVARITTEIMASGIQKIKWTNLEHLPAMQNQDIRALTEDNFSFLGIKKDSPIFTISSSRKGKLLNEQLELNSVLGFLEKNAVPVFDGILEQQYKKMNNYTPLLKVYQNKNTVYLAVFEPEGEGFEGCYIYCFEKDPTYKLQNNSTIGYHIEQSKNKRGIK